MIDFSYVKSIHIEKLQIFILLCLTVLFLFYAPESWYFSPDSGLYIGTARDMLTEGRYYFNGYPNLQYYPGTSLTLLLPIAIFGIDFHVLHIFHALMVMGIIYLATRLYDIQGYGKLLIILPLIIASNSLIQRETQILLSGTPFLLCVFCSLVAWKNYVSSQSWKYFILASSFAAFAPLIRTEGVFLVAAFGLAYLFHSFKMGGFRLKSFYAPIVVTLLVSLPFILWTYRNYLLHTPDTFAMSNNVFFGLKSLSLYGAGFGKLSWTDGSSHLGLYNLYYTTLEFIEAYVGTVVNYRTPLGNVIFYSILISFVLAGLAGLKKWFYKATVMELIFFTFFFVFLIYWALKQNSFNPVVRVWVPLVPLFSLLMLSGVQELYFKLKNIQLKRFVVIFYSSVLAVVMVNGLMSFAVLTSEKKALFHLSRNETLKQMASYINENTLDSDVFTVDDWGVMPFYIERQTYMLLGGDNHILTLQRIYKYNSKYLAHLETMNKQSFDVANLVKEYPMIFTLLDSFSAPADLPTGYIYQVNPAALKQVLEAHSDKVD
jgi:hypothetical protein